MAVALAITEVLEMDKPPARCAVRHWCDKITALHGRL